MMPATRQHTPGSMRQRLARAFTLAELLVVMAIIAIIATITVVSVRGITDSARLSSGISTVTAALDNARALAMKNGRIVMVVFRPRLDGKQQRVEIVTAQWLGDSIREEGATKVYVYDRFVPIPDMSVRTLPRGIQVAGPFYRDPNWFTTPGIVCGRECDMVWITQSYLPRHGNISGDESRGELIGVMFAPDGRTITYNTQNDSTGAWIDFDNDGVQEVDFNDSFEDTGYWWEFDHPDDETYINIVPFLAVYDDEEARDMFGDDDWGESNYCNRLLDLTDYITAHADRVHFNRYTGVVMR